MNKKTITIIIILAAIILAGGVYFWNYLRVNYKDNNGCFVNQGYKWCEYGKNCIKSEEECRLNAEWILGKGKEIIGMNLNIMPNESIKWNNSEGEIIVSAKGIYYLDLLGAEKISKAFDNWKSFLEEQGFESDSYNPESKDEKSQTIKYKKEEIVCSVEKKDNSSNSSSSVGFYCGNISDTICGFQKDCGRECQSDSDCGLKVDGCAKKTVCRNKNYNFYNNCSNPTSKVSELNTDINGCKCVNNQCVPEKDNLYDKNW